MLFQAGSGKVPGVRRAQLDVCGGRECPRRTEGAERSRASDPGEAHRAPGHWECTSPAILLPVYGFCSSLGGARRMGRSFIPTSPESRLSAS